MKYLITYFYNIRFFSKNMIPISTAIWDPAYFHSNSHNQNICFIDKNGIMNGIKEDALIFKKSVYESLDEQCSRDCGFYGKAPHCKFMDIYRKQLSEVDFNGYLLPEFARVAEEVRKATHYEGEPIIVLLVHEKPDKKCSERPCLVEAFKNNGIDLLEFDKSMVK